jgi:hypothetical protein
MAILVHQSAGTADLAQPLQGAAPAACRASFNRRQDVRVGEADDCRDVARFGGGQVPIEQIPTRRRIGGRHHHDDLIDVGDDHLLQQRTRLFETPGAVRGGAREFVPARMNGGDHAAAIFGPIE